jgi:uncharacterized protein (UPF0262 family)
MSGREVEEHGRLIAVAFDGTGGDTLLAVEREAAIRDLIAENRFHPKGCSGPFRLRIAVSGDWLVLDIADEAGQPVSRPTVALAILSRVVRDYRMIAESHQDALRGAHQSRIEAIDMGRRGLHDEGARILMERLNQAIELDFATARRLFTLVSALPWRR